MFPALASAQSSENVTKRRPDKPAQAQIQEVKQEVRSNVAEKHASRLEKRFSSYYIRLNNIITRFQTRLDMLRVEGKIIAPTQTKLDLAKAKLAQAKTMGDEAIMAFKAIDPVKFSEQKTEAFAARDTAKLARELFQETHNLLKDALKELKTISKPALPAAQEAL